MIFKLKCKSCGNIVTYDPNETNSQYRRCNKCEQCINMRTETKLNNVLYIDDFELIGIEQSFKNEVLAEDLSRIEKLFDEANEDDQKIISNIIDKIYLMLNRKDNITLKELERVLSQYFYDSCGKEIEL